MCFREEYSTRSRRSANVFEVLTKSSEEVQTSFSKEVSKNKNSDSTAGQKYTSNEIKNVVVQSFQQWLYTTNILFSNAGLQLHLLHLAY